MEHWSDPAVAYTSAWLWLRHSRNLGPIAYYSDNETEATDYSVVGIKVHPGWRPQDSHDYGGGEGEGEEGEPSKPFDNDIALLTLDQQVGSSDTLGIMHVQHDLGNFMTPFFRLVWEGYIRRLH